MADAKITALNTLTNAGLATGDLLVIEDADATETKAITIGEIDNRFAAASHTHATTDITSGTFADARIAASNVTQHQASLSITESQISDLQSYLVDITAEALSSLADVTITTIASGEVLAWNGSAWINRTLSEAGIAAASHTHATSDITSGTFADARIAASNVTQHQASLSITESQISDLQSYLLDITAEALSSLADVTITSIASGEVLTWNGSAWINNTLAEAGIAAASHTHTESDITDLATYVKADGTVSFSGNQAMGGNRLTGLGTPSSSTDAATKAYVDSMSSGLTWKDSVRLATTAAGTLASDFEDGDTVDNETLATGDRILIKNQASPAENGIYTVNASGAPTRATDLDTGVDAAAAAVFVQDGDTNGDNGFVCTSDSGSAVVGTNALTWAQFTGTGGGETNTVSNVGAGTGVFKQKTGVDFELYSLGATSTIALAINANEIEISVTQSGIDHGSISGLSDDDHTQYALLAGRSGGSDYIGGTASGDDLTLESTSHATKGVIQSKDAHQFDATAYFAEVDNGNSSTADTIDFTAGNKHKSTLTGNCTYTFTAPPGPCNLILRLIQDGTGSRTVTWPATVKWPGGTAPTLTTDASAIDIVSFYFDGTNYYGQTGLDFS